MFPTIPFINIYSFKFVTRQPVFSLSVEVEGEGKGRAESNNLLKILNKKFPNEIPGVVIL